VFAITPLFHGLEAWAPEPHRVLLAALRIGGLAAAGLVLAIARRRRRRIFGQPVAPIGLALRGVAYAILSAILFASVAQSVVDGGRSFANSCFTSALLLALAAWVAAAVRPAPAVFAAPGRGLRVADALLGATLAVLVVAEAALTLYERLDPSPFTIEEALGARRIDAYRLPPGSEWRGIRANSRGYHDDEFFVATGDDLVVALLGNSFATGIVPREYNVATVAERALAARLAGRHGRVAIHNFGVASISMPEYAWLVRHEVLATRPTLVVLLVAFGSDIHSLVWKHRFYSLQYFRVSAALRRLRLAAQERAAMERIRHRISTTLDPHWNPAEDVPTLSVEDHLAVEVNRLEYTDPNNRAVAQQYRRFDAALDELHRLLGDKLRVVLIPDEFQVDDEVWEHALERVATPGIHSRHLPQERITAHCREHGIPVLDLQGVLAEAQREGPVHHPRDTHWNTRGNRVAGEAIARFIALTLPEAGLAGAAASR
jgi:hypothetical protein